MPAFKDRTGETRVMLCGMEATIIEYKNSHDITVRFSDGTVVEHRLYGDYQKGKISNPSLVESADQRIGKTKTMNCGLDATIIAYRKCNDIDVQFEDGNIVSHRLYQDFLRGEISHPHNVRIGYAVRMPCGRYASVVAYRSISDVDIRFEDGVMINHRTYAEFINKEIIHPQSLADVTARIGETQTMNCGMRATIIAYRSSKDIDIQFEDGTIVKNKAYSNFCTKRILHPMFRVDKTSRIGETKKMNCGLDATIIAYRKSNDIDVQFEDGEIALNKSYGNFCVGRIEHPTIRASSSLPERIISGYLKAARINFKAEWYDPELRGLNNRNPLYFDFALFDEVGELLALIEYQGLQHYEVISSFGGEKHLAAQQARDRKKREYVGCRGIPLLEIPPTENDICAITDFLNKHLPVVLHNLENIQIPVSSDTIEIVDMPTYRIGETRQMNCGLSATIISYRSSADIDVLFSDGTIVQNCSYRRFVIGEVIPQHLKMKVLIQEERIGESNMMACGMEATIVAYRNARDVDLEFADGTIVKHRLYSEFKSGVITNPTLVRKQQKELANSRVGQTLVMRCGMKATIIAYHGSNNIDVQFEDGAIARNRYYSNFIRGGIDNPNTKLDTSKRKGETRTMKCGMDATIVEYRKNTDIDVLFSDGTLVKHKAYACFQAGGIMNPSIYSNRIGESKIMNCGMSATIIEYRSSSDIDIEFSDGTIVKNKSYRDFKRGAIANLSLYKRNAHK